MKRYIRSNSSITTYRGYDIGMEDNGDQRYYFQTAPGKFEYADTIDELKSRIDNLNEEIPNDGLHEYQVLYLTTSDTCQYTVVEAKDKPSAKQIAKKKIGRDFTRCIGINEI